MKTLDFRRSFAKTLGFYKNLTKYFEKNEDFYEGFYKILGVWLFFQKCPLEMLWKSVGFLNKFFVLHGCMLVSFGCHILWRRLIVALKQLVVHLGPVVFACLPEGLSALFANTLTVECLDLES